VLTQYLQISLGYSALQSGLRVLPAAGAIAVIAPLSTSLVRVVGTKVTVATGLLIIGAGRCVGVGSASRETGSR
jgi:cyanate permease